MQTIFQETLDLARPDGGGCGNGRSSHHSGDCHWQHKDHLIIIIESFFDRVQLPPGSATRWTQTSVAMQVTLSMPWT